MLQYSINLMSQLAVALRVAGFTCRDVTKLLSSVQELEQFREVIYGRAQIVKVKHFIDLDVDPRVPDGWKVVEHRKGGQLEWDLANVTLYFSKSEHIGGIVPWHELREELKEQLILNANVLDNLLANPGFIFDAWRGETIFFFGTIFCHSDGFLVVRCLRWHHGKCYGDYCSLSVNFSVDNPVAILAN